MCRLAISVFPRIDEKNTSAHSCEAAQGREASWAAADDDGIPVVTGTVMVEDEGIGHREEDEEEKQHHEDEDECRKAVFFWWA